MINTNLNIKYFVNQKNVINSRVGRWHLPAVFTGKYRRGQYSQKWRLPAFTGIYKYFINFSSNYIVDSPSYLL